MRKRAAAKQPARHAPAAAAKAPAAAQTPAAAAAKPPNRTSVAPMPSEAASGSVQDAAIDGAARQLSALDLAPRPSSAAQRLLKAQENALSGVLRQVEEAGPETYVKRDHWAWYVWPTAKARGVPPHSSAPFSAHASGSPGPRPFALRSPAGGLQRPRCNSRQGCSRRELRALEQVDAGHLDEHSGAARGRSARTRQPPGLPRHRPRAHRVFRRRVVERRVPRPVQSRRAGVSRRVRCLCRGVEGGDVTGSWSRIRKTCLSCVGMGHGRCKSAAYYSIVSRGAASLSLTAGYLRGSILRMAAGVRGADLVFGDSAQPGALSCTELRARA